MKFLRSILSNSDGTGSSNRTAMLLIVVALLVWTTISVWRTGQVPDISTGWVSILMIFVGGTLGGKAADAITAIKAPGLEDEEEPKA